MRTQQMDPIAQAMQLLQFITQRRGQQAEIEQGSRRLDLQEAQQQQDALQFARQIALSELAQKQGAQQFGKKMSFDEQQAQMTQQRFEEEQRQKMLDRARGMSEFERQYSVTAPYQQAITNQINQKLLGKDKDPQLMALEEEQRKNAAALMQAQLMSGNLNAIERSRLQDQYDAAMQQWYGKMLPPKRDYTPNELKTIQTFQ